MFKKIEKGATIGLLAPAYIPIQERVENGIKYLQNNGYKIKLSRNINNTNGHFAGTDQQRIDDIHELFADEDVSALLCARGGWGTLRLLDKLDYNLIQKNPKPLIGYSDITTLQLAIWRKTGIGSISGPMFAVEMGKGIVNFTEDHFWNYIQNEKNTYTVNIGETKSEVLCSGKAKGRLLGGCLSLVSFLQGTPYCPDFTGAILFLEDVGEKPYKIDRYLAHLKQCGIFDQISGLILGDFLDCIDEDGKENVETIIQDYFSGADYPVIYNFPYGHDDVKVSMPIGAQTELDTKNQKLTFENLFE